MVKNYSLGQAGYGKQEACRENKGEDHSYLEEGAELGVRF